MDGEYTSADRPRGPKGRACKHGHSYDPVYRAWQTMRLRCTVPSNPAFGDYGARGITVCARWLDSVDAFVSDMGPKPTPKHELDRRNNGAGYWCGRADCPECGPLGRESSCRWVTRAENDRNRRSNRLVTCRGETLPLVAWSERSGVRPDTIADRLARGWSSERAIETPARPKAPNGFGEARQHARRAAA